MNETLKTVEKPKYARMFPFITATWNPLGGECKHKCSYCWAKILIKRNGYTMAKYSGPARIYSQTMEKKFKQSDFVFVCDMTDLFGSWVPREAIQQILDYITKSPATFLLLTKNPARYHAFDIPANCVCGATIETNLDNPTSEAPRPYDRINAMIELKHPRKMISIEPILQFSEPFHMWLVDIHPEFVAVGYDNYRNHMGEPSLIWTLRLIEQMEKAGITVYRKTIRDAISPFKWNG
jgi:protein gp37